MRFFIMWKYVKNIQEKEKRKVDERNNSIMNIYSVIQFTDYDEITYIIFIN